LKGLSNSSIYRFLVKVWYQWQDGHKMENPSVT